MHVDRGVPPLPVQRRGVDQMQQVGAEGERGGHGEHRECGAGQGGAHRHRGAPAAGFQRQPHPGCRGHRHAAPASHALSRGQPGAGVVLSLRVPLDVLRHAGHAARATSSPDGGDAGEQHRASALTPGSGSATRAAPTGISGDTATATPAATTAPWRRRRPPRSAPRPSAGSGSDPGPPAPGYPRACGEQPGGHLTDDQQRGSREHHANRASATASGRMARSMAAACVPSSATNAPPPVAGNRRVSDCARRPNASGEAPGRNLTYAPAAPRYRTPSR